MKVLEKLFNPRAAAVIGASTDPWKFGGTPVHLSLQRGFAGKLYPVNPTADVVQGLKAYPDLASIEGEIDCAVISVPVAAVPDAVRACVAKGIEVATVFSAGFAEAGPEGRRIQDEMVAIARPAGLRLVGPNCMGALSLSSNFIATFTSSFLDEPGLGFPERGAIGIASQSGAVGVHAMVALRDRGLGLSKWITTGNQCDVEIADCIAYYAEDPEISVVLAYIEGVRDYEAFARALDAARRQSKPVILLKVGRSKAGAAAALAHTTSLVGDDRAFDALVREHGAFRAAGFGELIDVAAAVANARPSKTRDIALVTTSGGIGALMADAATEAGLVLAPPPEPLRQELAALAPLGAVGNPLDTGAVGMRDMSVTLRFIEAALASGAYGAVIAFLAHLCLLETRRTELAEPLLAIKARFPDRALALVGSVPEALRERFERAGILVYAEPAAAVAAVAALADLGAPQSA